MLAAIFFAASLTPKPCDTTARFDEVRTSASVFSRFRKRPTIKSHTMSLTLHSSKSLLSASLLAKP